MVWKNFFQLFRESVRAKAAGIYFAVGTLWWLSIFARGLEEGFEVDLFTNVYGLLALWGGAWGLSVAKAWGGFKSVFGRALSFISFGLLAQFLGQISYNTYIYLLGVEVPYPSFGDVGYFGSVILYMFGVASLFRVVGFSVSRMTRRDWFLVIVLPALLLGSSYAVFLREYDFMAAGGLALFLDFAYPLGQAVYVSMALLVFLLSRSTLGGMMRLPFLLLLFSLVFQYFCDYTFLLQVQRGTWHVSGINDYMYFASYFIMTISLGVIGMTIRGMRGNTIA